MKRALGIIGIFLAILVFSIFFAENFTTGINLMQLTNRTALYSVLALGAALVIVTGGIDLSIGSVVCLAGIMTPWLLIEHEWTPWQVIPTVLAMSAFIGLCHGLLITRLKLQPFLVTLCGLLLYRGIARWMTGDQSQGFMGEYGDVRAIALAKFSIPGLTRLSTSSDGDSGAGVGDSDRALSFAHSVGALAARDGSQRKRCAILGRADGVARDGLVCRMQFARRFRRHALHL